MREIPKRRVSLWGSLDPRVRILAATLGSVVLAVLHTPQAACAGLVLALVLTAGSVSRELPRRLALVNVFVLFLWLIVPLTAGGELLTHWGPLEVSRRGVDLALLVTLKANAVFLLFQALLNGMEAPVAGQALEHLHVPVKLVFLMLFTFHFLQVLLEEWERLGTAARLRGFVARTSMHSYRTIGYQLGMVLVRGLDRSRRVYEAMLLRGFAGHFRSVARFRARGRDSVFMGLFVPVLALVAIYDLFGGGTWLVKLL